MSSVHTSISPHYACITLTILVCCGLCYLSFFAVESVSVIDVTVIIFFQFQNDNASRLLTGFVPSLGIDLSEAQTSGSQKMLSLSRCCGQCLPSSRVGRV